MPKNKENEFNLSFLIPSSRLSISNDIKYNTEQACKNDKEWANVLYEPDIKEFVYEKPLKDIIYVDKFTFFKKFLLILLNI